MHFLLSTKVPKSFGCSLQFLAVEKIRVFCDRYGGASGVCGMRIASGPMQRSTRGSDRREQTQRRRQVQQTKRDTGARQSPPTTSATTGPTTRGEGDLQLLDQVLQVTLGGLFRDDLEHLLADGTDLAGLGVGSGLRVLGVLLGESDGEDAQDVSIRGADVNVGLNQGSPLADQGVQLVAGHVQTVEVGHDVQTLNILAHQANLAESLVLVTAVELGKRDLEDTTLQTLRGDLCGKAAIRRMSTIKKRISSVRLLVPWVREMMVLPAFLVSKMEGALMEYNSFLKKGSTAFFLPPFFPFVNLLFLPERRQRKIVPKSVPTILFHYQR